MSSRLVFLETLFQTALSFVGRPVLVLFILAVFCVGASGQDYIYQTGSPVFSVAQPALQAMAGQGFVNIANGNLHLEFPFGDAPQRGSLRFRVALVYDSRIWQVVPVGGSLLWKPTNLPGSSGGWRVITSADPGRVTFDQTSAADCTGTTAATKFSNFVWHAPDGTQRKFLISTLEASAGCASIASADGFAADASGYHLYVSNFKTATIYAKDGTQVFPTVQDTNGNHFSTDANGNVKDTLGRTVVTVTSNPLNGNQTFYDVLNSQGKTSRYTVTTAPISVHTGFSGSQAGITDDREVMIVVSSLTMPNGDVYSFTYDQPQEISSTEYVPGYGLVQSISHSTLGTIATYAYSNFIDAFGVVNRWETNSLNGTVSYSTTACPGASCLQTATVTRNSDHLTFDFTMNGGAWLTDYSAFSGSRRILFGKNTYDFSQTCSGCQGSIDVRLLTSRINRGGLNAQTVYGYDSPSIANVTSIQEWNYWAGDQNTAPPPTPDRQTIIAYKTDSVLTSKNIVNRPGSVTLRDRTGQVNQTVYDYDGNPLVGAGLIFNHTDSADVHRGNLTHVGRWNGGTSFLDTFLTYDTAGQVVQIKDPAGNVTGFSYTDNFFNDNGTDQPPSANPAQPTDAYLSTITLPRVGNISIGYYFGSGQQAFVADPNGQRTFAHYLDSLGRPTQVVSPKGWTAISYSSSFDEDIYSGIQDSQPSTACSSCVHTQVSFDFEGHPLKTTLASDPAGPVTYVSGYDFMGNPLTVTNPSRTRQLAPPETTYSYDVLYRLTQVFNPDRSLAHIYYGDDPTLATAGGTLSQSCPATTYGLGFPTLSVDEAGRKREVWEDAFGRVIEVDEPDSSNHFAVPTCNTYNAGNELTGVAQGSLTRSYHYDPLWRVTQVTTPEGGTETFSYLTDAGALCSGDVGAVCKKVDARGISIRYQYDAASHLIQKSYSDGTPTAVFNYAESTALGGLAQLTNTIGRLSSMYTQDASGKMLTGEAFSYDAAGNVIANPQCTPQNCGTSVFQNSYTPDFLGDITSYTNSWGRSITATYNNAVQLTSLGVTPNDALHPATIFSDAKYNEFGLLTQASLGNGLVDARNYSPTTGNLSAVRIGSVGDFNQAAPGNIAAAGRTTISISGSVKQVTTTATAGSAVLTISGATRQIANGTQQPLPSTGTLTISGQEQSKQTIETDATAGTGTLNFSGTLQSEQNTQPGTNAGGTVNIGGSLQVNIVNAAAASPGSGSVTIGGHELATTTTVRGRCTVDADGNESCLTSTITTYDSGNVTITVNGHPDSVPFGQGYDAGTIAKNLIDAINKDTAAVVSAGLSGTTTVVLTARSVGASTNYTLTASASSGLGSFTATASGPNLTQGADAVSASTTDDSGAVTMSVGGFSATVNYGSGAGLDSTGAAIAADLVAKIHAQLPVTNPPFSISVPTNSTDISVAFNVAGVQSAQVVSSTTETSKFSGPSFAACTVTSNPQSCSISLGGKNPVTTTVYDAGTVNATVGGHTTPYQWSGSATTAASITTGIMNAINTDPAAVVNASPLTSTSLTLTSRTTGVTTNYSAQVSVVFDSADFSASSFTGSFLTPTLMGGADAIRTPLYDSGTFSAIVNNYTDSVSWGSTSTPETIAADLATVINLDPAAPETAQATGNVLTFTTKATGSNTNYAYGAQVTNDATDFLQVPFSYQPNTLPLPTLDGGRDSTGTVSDTGTITVTINGFTKTVNYEDPLWWRALVNAFDTDPNSPVWACVCTNDPTGKTLLTFTARKLGTGGNYPISASTATNNPSFTGSSYSVSLSSPTLLGGANAGGPSTTLSDAGNLSLTIGSFQASLEYGQNSSIPSSTLICCTASAIATALANIINQSSSAPVIAAVTGGQLELTAKNGGADTNYSFSAAAQSNDSATFVTPSFSFSSTSGKLAGGTDKPNPALGSSSIGAVAINGGGAWSPFLTSCNSSLVLGVSGTGVKASFSTCFDNVSPFDPVSFAAKVAQTINAPPATGQPPSPIIATASGNTVYLQSTAGGADSNYALTTLISGAPGGNAPPVSFLLTGPAMTGGSDNGGFAYALDLGIDSAGNVFSADDSVNGNWTYLYDLLGRLEQATTPAVGYTYGYDRYGNRTAQTPLNGGNSLSLTYLNNQIVGAQYDLSGNMTSDGTHTYAYDAENRLISVDSGATASYLYSADGLRVRSTVGGLFSDYIHDLDGNTAGVLGANGALIRQEIGGMATYSDVAYFQHRDWLGNLRAITDYSGALRQTCTNLPFGDGLTCNSSEITPTHFTGYSRDGESGLDFANARYFTSQFGRFVSPDPMGGDPADPQSLNRYAYSGNSPLSRIDPSGMAPDCPGTFCFWGSGSGSTGGAGISGGPFGGGDGSGEVGGGGSLGLCALFDCGFGGSGPSLPGPPTSNQLGSETSFMNEPLTGMGATVSHMPQADQYDAYRRAVLASGDIPLDPLGYGVIHQKHRIWNSAYSWGKAAYWGTLGAIVVPAGIGELATMGTMQVAVMEGEPFHVAFGADGTMVHAAGNLGDMTIEELPSRFFTLNKIPIYNLPVLNPGAVVPAIGSAAVSCVTSACMGFVRGWVPFL